MSDLSATQFMWAIVGEGAPWPPPVDKRGPAPDDRCWLCGGLAVAGWWRDSLPPTFTNHNTARVPVSQTVCQACMALAAKESWSAYCARFPDRGLKTGHAMSWRCYSHAVSPTGHDCPTRARWRALLVEPPAPPFLLALAVSGQKHILFRAQIAYDRDCYPLQMEEDTLFVWRAALSATIAAVEELLAAGFTRAEIEADHYPSHRIKAAGLARWRSLRTAYQEVGHRWPQETRVALHVAQRPPTPGDEIDD